MNVLFGMLSFISLLIAAVFVWSGAIAESAPQEGAAFAGACFFGIMARIFQAQSVIEAGKSKEREERKKLKEG